MSVSTQRIHTIQSAFSSPSRFGLSTSNMEASWNRIPNVCAPRARPYDNYPVPRTSLASGASSTGSTGLGMRVGVSLSASGSRPRRMTVSYPSPTPMRRATPPSAPAERTASALTPSIIPAPLVSVPAPVPEIDDPFADADQDENAFTPLSPPPPARTSSPRTRVSVSTYTVPSSRSSRSGSMSSGSFTTPPGLGHTIPSAKDTRGRLVASVLLSRTSGRPLGVYLRRRLSGEQQTYVKSGLSQLVAAAA